MSSKVCFQKCVFPENFTQKGTSCAPGMTLNCDSLLFSVQFLFFRSPNQPFGYNCISCFKRCCYCYNFFNFNHCKVISSLCHDWASWRCRSFMFDTFSNEKPSYVTKPHTNSYFRPKRRSVIGANLGLFAPYSHCLLFVPLPLQNKCFHKFYQANEII